MAYTVITPDEWGMAVFVANQRLTSALKAQKKERSYKAKDWVDSLGSHIKGTVGELAVAKVLGVPWSGSVDTWHDTPDLKNVEVKHRASVDWQMILRDHDHKDAIYVLARGLPPDAVEVAGWIRGEDAMVDAHWQTSFKGLKPCWMVPDSALKDISLLRKGVT